jgi:hypothetical protein
MVQEQTVRGGHDGRNNSVGEGGKVEGEIVEDNMVLGHKYTMRKSGLGRRPRLLEKIFVGQMVQGPKAEGNMV